ncbi:MAG: coenzyme F420-0:L-glutamate ligase, partial [Bdellovibrionia bacterium]
ASLERQILCVTSKIISLSERAIVPKDQVASKMDLVRAESDEIVAKSVYGTALTIKHGILIPAAGIDESNAAGEFYILLPKDPYASANALHAKLKTHYKLKEFGLILTDSHTHPLRRGVTGIGLAHAGFQATRSMIGEKDLFGRPLAMTYVNVLDALSVAAVYAMGESSESSPLALVQADGIQFSDQSSDASEVRIKPQDDLYEPILRTRE